MHTDGTEGTQDAREIRAHPVPHPAPGPDATPAAPHNTSAPGQGISGAPAAPTRPAGLPPRPAAAPGESPGTAADQGRGGPGAEFLDWLRTPRPKAPTGVWRPGHVPRAAEEPELTPVRQLISGALIAFLVGWLIWSLLWNGYLGGWWLLPLYAMIPDSWAEPHTLTSVIVVYAYYGLVAAGIAIAVGRLGRWGEVWQRFGYPAWSRPANTPAQAAARTPQDDPARWPGLRALGAEAAADRLSADARSGRMRDVDLSRINRAWEGVRGGRLSRDAFTEAVVTGGAAACPHPSGDRDVPGRLARHDLLTEQVRIGVCAESPRNPYAYRGVPLALAPELLATSMLAVGPSGSGKSSALVRPLAESLCLGALAGRTAVVVVGAAGSGLGAAEAYDVVIRVGDPASEHDLDLYGGTADPDEAAAVLAEALTGDLTDPGPGSDGRRATTVLAQLLGPFRAVHGRFPSVPELRRLLDGSPTDLAALRTALTGRGDGGGASMLRELDARERQSERPGDLAGTLADRIALLDRPAFEGFFDTSSAGRPFSLRALDHPVRVRIDLPQRGHADASRILTRLLLAQFSASTALREDRSLFACLVLDEASGAVTPESVRAVQRLRSAHAGVVLTLRTLDDVPRNLRGPLLGSVGCRVALSGLTPWDGQDFAEAWGKEWTEARDVTDRQIVAESPMGKAAHAVRRAITGRAPTARAVTVRQVERERWSASELAHQVPSGHAVLSLATVRGEHAPPLLVDLRG